MIYSIAIILILLWLVGLMSSATLGGFIHVLLLIAVIMVLLRVMAGRKPIRVRFPPSRRFLMFVSEQRNRRSWSVMAACKPYPKSTLEFPASTS
jgi:hypothetical protein